MNRYTTYLFVVICIQSCIPPSTDQIKNIDTPDNSKTKDFGIEISGHTIYQFYQKYGFTDLEEQLILIIKPDNVDFLTATLPFDSIDINRLEKIDIRKFTKDKPIIFAPEKTMQADIRLESTEYDSGQGKSVFLEQGRYVIFQNDSVETIFVFDSKSELMYIESKK